MTQVNKLKILEYNPQSNPVERFHRDLGRILRALLPRELNEWSGLLPTICSCYNSKINNSTSLTPNLVFLGREVELTLGVPQLSDGDGL